jgi:hypothetical protein
MVKNINTVKKRTEGSWDRSNVGKLDIHLYLMNRVPDGIAV